MTPWLRLTRTLIGLALVGLFLRLSPPAFLNHPVVVSKPGLASWREPAPAHRIDLSEHEIRSGSRSTSPTSGPRLCVDEMRSWSTRPPDSQATGTDRTLASSRSKLAAHNELSSHFFPRNYRPIPSNLKSWAFATAFS